MKRILCFGIASLVSCSAFAANPICVRNYLGDSAENPCEMFPSDYAYVLPLKPDADKAICARAYADFYCGQTKTYEHVKSLKKGTICVLNNNQPPVANLCKTTPQFYDYIAASWED